MSNRGRPIGHRKTGGRKPGAWKLLTSEKLREFREKNNISRARLSKLLGVSTTSIQNWEVGKCPPSMRFQSKLVEIMASPTLVGALPQRLGGLFQPAGASSGEAAEIEITGEIVNAWLRTNPKASPADVVRVTKDVRQALR